MSAALPHVRNVVSQAIAIIFVSDTLNGPAHLNLESLEYDNAQSRGNEYFNLFKNDLKYMTKLIQRPTTEVIEQTYSMLNEISLKFKEQHFLSDETKVGGMAWHELRVSAMKKDYTEQAWYTDITDEDKRKLEELREAQARQNNGLRLAT